LAMRRKCSSSGEVSSGEASWDEGEVFFGVVMVVTLGWGGRPYPLTQNLLQSLTDRRWAHWVVVVLLGDAIGAVAVRDILL